MGAKKGFKNQTSHGICIKCEEQSKEEEEFFKDADQEEGRQREILDQRQ